MRLHFGRIPDSPDFSPEKEGWTPLREPKFWVYQVAGTVTGLVAAVAVFQLWAALTPATRLPQSPIPAPERVWLPVLVAASVVGLIATHEGLHMAVHPGGGTRRASVLGVWPAGMLAYAHYDGPMSRNRFVAMILCPFVVLSLALLAVWAAAGLGWPVAAGWSVVNAAFAGGDLVTAGLVLAQVPARAEVRNQGWWTWWRSTDAEPPLHPTGPASRLSDGRCSPCRPGG